MVKRNTDFINKHIKKYGILGTNTPHDPPIAGQLNFKYSGQIWTENNHFKFGYNRGLYNPRLSGSDEFWMEFGKRRREPLSLLEEIVYSLKQIQQTFNRPIKFLTFSMVPATLNQINDMINEKGLDVEIVSSKDVSQSEYFNSSTFTEYTKEFCNRYDSGSMVYPLMAYNALHTDKIVVGDIIKIAVPKTMNLFYSTLNVSEENLSLFRFSMHENINLVPSIYMWSPEIYLRFIDLHRRFEDQYELGIKLSNIFSSHYIEDRKRGLYSQRTRNFPLYRYIEKMNGEPIADRSREIYGEVQL